MTFSLSAMAQLGMSAGASAAPDCLSHGTPLLIDNARVLNFKRTTANQFHDRGHVAGVLKNIFPDATGHHHMEVALGPNSDDVIEIIYNEAFGSMPALTPGMQVEACGDYITSNAPSGHFPASPDGALMHWVHKSPSPTHDSGFVVLGGVLCGQDTSGASSGHGHTHGGHSHGHGGSGHTQPTAP